MEVKIAQSIAIATFKRFLRSDTKICGACSGLEITAHLLRQTRTSYALHGKTLFSLHLRCNF